MPDLHQRAHELELDFKAMAKVGGFDAPYIGLHRDRYLKASATADWKRLKHEAAKAQQQANSGLIRLAPATRDLSRLQARAMAYVTEARAGWVPPRSRPEWPEIRERILANLPRGTPSSKADELVRQIGALRATDVAARVFEPLRSMAERLEAAHLSWQAALLGAKLADCVSRFNGFRRVALDEPRNTDSWLRDAVSTLEAHEKAIWRALRRGAFDEVRSAARALLRWADGEVLERAIRTAAGLARARGRMANRWTLGPRALATADLIRDLIAAQALAHRGAWIATLGFGPAADWGDAAANRAFATRWQPAPSTPIAYLWSQSRRFDGKEVTIEGVAGPVSNPHRRRKVYSSVWVSDSSGISMRVGITHIKLDSGGLVDGAYVRMTGKFVAADKDFGTPVLRIGRRTLVADSEHAWQDWATLRGRTLFTPVPHALTMSFSWEAGLDGPGNQLRYGTWLPYERRD